MPETPKPGHVVAYERTCPHGTKAATRPVYVDPECGVPDIGSYYKSGDTFVEPMWCYRVPHRAWRVIPDLDDAAWRSDVMDGLLAKGVRMTFFKGTYKARDGFTAVLNVGDEDVDGHGPTTNAALEAAVLAALKAQP